VKVSHVEGVASHNGCTIIYARGLRGSCCVKASASCNSTRYNSRAGFIDHRFPNTFRLENECNRVADRAAASSLSLRVRAPHLLDLRNGVPPPAQPDQRGALREDAAHRPQHTRQRRVRYSCLSENFPHMPTFLTTGALRKCRALRSGDATTSKSGGVGQREPLIVVSIKGFDLERRLLRLGQLR
jgi:hypothetical protein